MQPIKSYRIWTSPRTGHTLLARLLEDTGVAGKPGEHLTMHEGELLTEKFPGKTFQEVVGKIWEAGSDQNGIFACKFDGHTWHYNTVIQQLKSLPGAPETLNDEEFWSHLFPFCKHIYLTRRNKIRQSVSWWKAIRDNTWHLENGDKRKLEEAFYQDKYDFNALLHLLKETALREASIASYFSQYNIHPLTLVYEDYIHDIKGTLVNILKYLNLDIPDHLPSPAFQKTANEHSEQWVQKFRKDLQDGWDKKAW